MKTVSRVLNNEPNVAKKTREKVLAVAMDLKYSPNLAARGLASSKSYLVALVYDTPSPCYISKIQSGAIDACRKFGYNLVPMPLQFPNEGEARNQAETVRHLLHCLPVDGVILTPPLSDSPSVIEALRAKGIPFVLVSPSGESADMNAVKMDDVQAAREMTEFLIAQGHKSIGFIKGHFEHSSATLRYQGFRDAMAAARLTVHDHDVRQGDFSFKSGASAAEELLADSASRPTAIFASNDDMAAGVVSAAARLGLNVPDDLSVCGFDDTDLAQILFPQLTTVQQPIYEMGFQAVQALVDPAQKLKPPVTQNLDFKLVVRESTLLQS